MPPPRTRKVVLITGASSGIGAAIARQAGALGHNLLLTARRGDRLEQLAGLIASGPGSNDVQSPEKSGEPASEPARIHIVAAALDDPATPERLVDECVAHFGGIDVLVNNAGFGLPTLFADGDPREIRRQLEVNFVAPLMLARQALPHLIAGRGTIINIGSAITHVPNSALGAYGATKAGLAYWNDALRRELLHKGVSICLVEPGPVKTEFFSALEKLAPPGGEYNPLLDAPYPWMSADVETVAKRIVRLIERPKRRTSVLRRVVWPFRLLGAIFQFSPALGDLALTSMTQYFDRRGDLARHPGRIGDARPSR